MMGMHIHSIHGTTCILLRHARAYLATGQKNWLRVCLITQLST